MKRKIIKKAICIGLLSVSLLGFSSVGANAEWKQDDNGWWNTEGSSYSTGWKEIGGNWYYFYSDGYMAQSQYIGNYYLGSDGAWTTNIPEYVKQTGVIGDNSKMVYVSINGTKYHRTPDGEGDKTREMTLNEAKKRGYQPDSKCWGIGW
ncbi:putative cell wall binding repeat protein [Clostridium puniceum]|uniref:Putative cell wall binding repeat protein n=1 Tax=Clostridium puniceum TaxID=29367 RepID=A0A1S8TQ61_9CLOT|nr:hypothetical protein [Clostridium puniceum]OOM79901.1 putative cell wall binding repeat protein [Clostridium puniceum]